MLPESVRNAIFWAADAVFGPWTIALLFGTGIFLTVRLRFVQVRRFGDGLRTLVPAAQEGARGPLTPFQAFMTALGASIGTGNIAGVATAIVTGGPGAVFWIWAYGFFATAIKFCEAVLGIKYRRLDGEHLSAGPMHYLRDGLKVAVAGLDLRARRRDRRPHHHAVHAAELHRRGAAERVRHPDLGLRHRDRGPGLAGHHRRHQVHRPRGGEAVAAEGRPVPRSAGCS